MSLSGLRTYTVLVVDDVAAYRRLIRAVLEDSNVFEVIGEAADGFQAIRLAQETQPDLVLLDLSMPQMDGLETLPQLLEVSSHSKVVVLSGFSHERMGRVTLERGASAYLQKGLTPEELVRELLKVMASEVPQGGE